MRKYFKHSLVPYFDLECETTETGRYYHTPAGKLPSVTTVLKEKLDNSWLEEWYSRVGLEKASRISAQAMKHGTAVHAIAERYLLNEDDYIKGALPHHVMAFEAIRMALDSSTGTIYAIEALLYSKFLNTAGRLDMAAEFNGIPSIIDFKTSKKKKTEEQIYSYFLQTTCYSMMFERLYGITVPQIVIIMAVEDEIMPLIFVKNRKRYIKEVLKIFVENWSGMQGSNLRFSDPKSDGLSLS